MLTVTLITVGKIKEKYFTDAIAEYSKRLSRYCKLNIIELKDEPTPDNPSDREKDAVLKKEGDRIAEKISKSAYVVALCIEGKMRDSVEFSKLIEQTAAGGNSEIVFIIGGSLGIHDEIKRRADLKLSFSEMTFPHQLMRVILLEQIYRAFNISGGGKYHK
ncbi:MAG: 23S rRNA (pseudouridine(1915)-N(3))-methyltransferase RlmH [Clostridia bacterium]|nr:23S rRNA (pseudouridine(1915)-N(3))-methyltransferase RlmH [Clostridia bacterium]